MKNISIELRKPELTDAEALLAISRDEAVMALFGDDPYMSIEHAQDVLQWCIDNFGQESHRWVIADKESDHYIGEIEFYDYIADHKRIQLGFRLASSHWKKGIMTKALKEAIAYAFGNFDYNRIEALVDVKNAACKALLTKCGFIHEGCLRQYELEDAAAVDLDMFSILKSDVQKTSE